MHLAFLLIVLNMPYSLPASSLPVVQFSVLDTVSDLKSWWRSSLEKDRYTYELTPHWKGFRTWVQKSSFAGEKALAHLRRDRGFNRRQRVSLQTQLAVFAGGKPALVTALMTPTDLGDRVNYQALSTETPEFSLFCHIEVLLKVNFQIGIFSGEKIGSDQNHQLLPFLYSTTTSCLSASPCWNKKHLTNITGEQFEKDFLLS